MIKAIKDFATQGKSFKAGDEVREDMFDSDFLMQPLINKGLVEVIEIKDKKAPENKVTPPADKKNKNQPAKSKAGKEK